MPARRSDRALVHNASYTQPHALGVGKEGLITRQQQQQQEKGHQPFVSSDPTTNDADRAMQDYGNNSSRTRKVEPSGAGRATFTSRVPDGSGRDSRGGSRADGRGDSHGSTSRSGGEKSRHPALPHDSMMGRKQEAPLPPPASVAVPAPAYEVPRRVAPKTTPPLVDEAGYFHTEEWPFTARQLDAEKEELLGKNPQVLDGKRGMPLLDADSFKQIDLPASGALARSLQIWDVECAMKHLDAVADSVVSHEELQGFTLMNGEEVLDAINLAGLSNAPGVFDEVTQQCRMVFTNQNRVIFTQAKHSAEVGVPKMRCLFALCACFHERWSTRKWSSFYASINASEILQVFVQQNLTTSYESSNCTLNDTCTALCCTVGGTMYSEKDMDGSTQTLGDHDPGQCVKRWDKTRFMRHALVIRYLDCSTNAVSQTIAMAHPDTKASQIFQMARAIEANITLRAADWLKCKSLPQSLAVGTFQNTTPSRPLFKRTSYKLTLFVLLIVAIIFVAAVNPVAGIFMIIAVLASLGGSYYNVAKAVRSVGFFGMNHIAKSMIVSQGGGAALYILAFVLGIANSSGSNNSESANYR